MFFFAQNFLKRVQKKTDFLKKIYYRNKEKLRKNFI